MTVLLFGVKRALVTLLGAIPDLQASNGGRVTHGPPAERGSAQLELVVGWSPDGDVGAEWVRDETSYDYGERESVSVTCLANAWHGGVDVEPLDDRLELLLNQIRDRLAADRRLGGLVTHARLGDRVIYQADGMDGGTSASVAFTVDAMRA